MSSLLSAASKRFNRQRVLASRERDSVKGRPLHSLLSSSRCVFFFLFIYQSSCWATTIGQLVMSWTLAQSPTLWPFDYRPVSFLSWIDNMVHHADHRHSSYYPSTTSFSHNKNYQQQQQHQKSGATRSGSLKKNNNNNNNGSSSPTCSSNPVNDNDTFVRFWPGSATGSTSLESSCHPCGVVNGDNDVRWSKLLRHDGTPSKVFIFSLITPVPISCRNSIIDLFYLFFYKKKILLIFIM